MAIEDQQMYDSARLGSELELIESLKRYGFTDVRQSISAEDKQHTDVFATFNGVQFKFDVKDLTQKYRTSRRYHLSTHMMDDIKKNKNSYKNHFIACKEYKSAVETGKFIIVKTLNAASIARQYHHHDNGKAFWLFNVDECMAKFPFKIL